MLAASIAAVLGLALLILGLRGGRIDDHPICRKCKFDLIGLPTQPNRDREGVDPSVHTAAPAPPRCPECGADLSTHRAVRAGAHRRRPAAIALGAVLVLAGAAAGGAIGWGRATRFDWNTVKPAWWLARDTNSRDETQSLAAATELVSRLGNGRVPPGAVAPVVEQTLARQLRVRQAFEGWQKRGGADPATYIDPRPALEPWLPLFDAADVKGGVSPSQAVRYLQQGLNPGAEVRRVVAAGSKMPLHCYATDNIGITSHRGPLGFAWELVSVEASGRALPFESWGTTRYVTRGSLAAWHGLHATPDLEPGEYELTLQWRFDVFLMANNTVPDASFTYVQRSPQTVRPAGAEVVELRAGAPGEDNPGGRPAVEIILEDDLSPQLLNMELEMEPLAVPVVGRVELRAGDKAWACGMVEWDTKWGETRWRQDFLIDLPHDLDPNHAVDLLIVPDRAFAAAETILECISGDQIARRGIRIRKRSEAESPAFPAPEKEQPPPR